MNDLINKKCVPCEGGVVPFDISEIHKYQKKVDGWDVKKMYVRIKKIKKYESNVCRGNSCEKLFRLDD